MEKILALIHTEGDCTVCSTALEAVQAAVELSKQLGGAQLIIGIVGENIKPVADKLAASGAVKFLGVNGKEFSYSRYSTDALAIEALCKTVQPSLVIAPSTARWCRVMAGAATRVNGVTDTHITGLSIKNGSLYLSRWFYRQRIEGVITRVHRPWFLLIEPGIYPAFKGDSDDVNIELVNVELPEEVLKTQFISVKQPPEDEQTIRPDAQLLFVAGAGWTKKQADGKVHLEEASEIILKFLKLTRASLGSSKSLVDLGSEGQPVLPFLSHMNQIGQTGATPRHPKGLSTCCHGEEPHTIGWRFINERRAINLDPNCGWARGKADVLYVADAFVVMKKVNELLENQQ